MPMDIRSYEAEMLESAEERGLKASLDRCCKRIISSKQIVSRIMQAVIPEYMDSTIDEIIPLIGKVSIGDTPVDRDTVPPVIVGEGVEDASISEGSRLYDIKFTARTPQDETIALIINLEIQNNFNAGYPLIKRAEYYVSRMISSQYGTVFTKSDYGKIQKVYSVWICTSPDKRHENTISLYKMKREDLVGKLEDTERDIRDYDLMNIVMICLGGSDTKECRGIIRMLYTLLVADIPAKDKKKIIHSEYSVPMEQKLDKEVESMCNVSSLYWDRGMKEGIAQGIEKGIAQGMEKGIAQGIAQGMEKGAYKEKLSVIFSLRKQGISTEIIAKAVQLSVDEVERIISENA